MRKYVSEDMKCDQRGRSKTVAEEVHCFEKKELTEDSQRTVGEMWKMAIGFYNLTVVSDFRE